MFERGKWIAMERDNIDQITICFQEIDEPLFISFTEVGGYAGQWYRN